MENALLVESASFLGKVPIKGFSRLYFGPETCEKKIPGIEEVRKAKCFCDSNKLAFSLVTPFCTDAGLEKLEKLFPLLSKQDEVIVNDLGVLNLASGKELNVVAGRLLNRQFRDPRIALFKGKFPKGLVEHLSQSQASSKSFSKFLKSFGVERIELDNLLQGIALSPSPGFRASLYFPIAFVAATRMCLAANCSKISSYNRVGIFDCGKECFDFKFWMRNKNFPKELLLSGNALFFENSKLPGKKGLSSRGIDRLVMDKTLAQLAQ